MKTFTALALTLSLSACSVGMAVSGSEEPELGAVRQGATRGEVEMQLGKPVRSLAETGAQRTDVYEYEMGNEPSACRALGHGVMDFLTLGLWEVIGTPIEAFRGEKYQVSVTYDQNDRVVAVR